MQAGWEVELGPDDDTLALPWRDESSGLSYIDLKLQPELLSQIEEARTFAELAEFLTGVNSQATVFKTAKCDIWATTEMNAEDEIFGAAWKFGSYIDILFSVIAAQTSFSAHEKLVKQLTILLRKVPEIPASADFVVRRCYLESEPQTDAFYVTLYLFGYGEEESHARRQWGIALKLVENALRQVSGMEIIPQKL